MYKDGRDRYMNQEERQRHMAMAVRLRDDWRNVCQDSIHCPLYLLACYSRHLDLTTPGARPATL